ncbi:MAG: glutathione S-transferase family protein [Bdellovibrionota bacterium]
MKLLHVWECPYCAKARIAFHEKAVEYESELVDLANFDGTVPVLIDEGQTISGSLIIAEYLEDRFPKAGTRLMPFDPLLRARVRTVFEMVGELGEAAYHLLQPDPGKKERLIADLKPLLSRIADQLDSKAYLVANFSLADIALIPHLFALREAGVHLPGQLPGYVAHVISRRSVGGDPYFERLRQQLRHQEFRSDMLA